MDNSNQNTIEKTSPEHDHEVKMSKQQDEIRKRKSQKPIDTYFLIVKGKVNKIVRTTFGKSSTFIGKQAKMKDFIEKNKRLIRYA